MLFGLVPSFENGAEHPEVTVGGTETGCSEVHRQELTSERGEVAVENGGLLARGASGGDLSEDPERRAPRVVLLAVAEAVVHPRLEAGSRGNRVSGFELHERAERGEIR